jgi:hypothetical protein
VDFYAVSKLTKVQIDSKTGNGKFIKECELVLFQN